MIILCDYFIAYYGQFNFRKYYFIDSRLNEERVPQAKSTGQVQARRARILDIIRPSNELSPALRGHHLQQKCTNRGLLQTQGGITAKEVVQFQQDPLKQGIPNPQQRQQLQQIHLQVLQVLKIVDPQEGLREGAAIERYHRRA